MDPAFWSAVLVGFAAQLIDGALGMAYGVVSTSFLLSLGVPPAQASAAVHTAEIFTTGVSGGAHALRRNVDWRFVARLAPAGVIGGVIGALLLSRIDSDVVRPFVAAYLAVMGLVILRLAIKGPPTGAPSVRGVRRLGFVGGLLDAIGGGWGPIVTSTLLGRGHPPRQTIGSVSLTEFFVTLAISAAFVSQIALGHLDYVAGLIVGGILAAPLAAHVVKIAPPRTLMAGVGVLIVALAGWQLAQSLRPGSDFMALLGQASIAVDAFAAPDARLR